MQLTVQAKVSVYFVPFAYDYRVAVANSLHEGNRKMSLDVKARLNHPLAKLTVFFHFLTLVFAQGTLTFLGLFNLICQCHQPLLSEVAVVHEEPYTLTT